MLIDVDTRNVVAYAFHTSRRAASVDSRSLTAVHFGWCRGCPECIRSELFERLKDKLTPTKTRLRVQCDLSDFDTCNLIAGLGFTSRIDAENVVRFLYDGTQELY